MSADSSLLKDDTFITVIIIIIMLVFLGLAVGLIIWSQLKDKPPKPIPIDPIVVNQPQAQPIPQQQASAITPLPTDSFGYSYNPGSPFLGY